MCMDSKIHAQSKSSIKEVNKFEFAGGEFEVVREIRYKFICLMENRRN